MPPSSTQHITNEQIWYDK